MKKNTNRTNRTWNIWAQHSCGVYCVDIVADISGRSATWTIPENIEIYQNGVLIHTDTFRIIGFNQAEMVAIVHADAEKIANRLNESHTYRDSAGALIFFNAVA